MTEYFRKPIVKTLMLKGQEGQSIKGIEKTGTSGLVDTYTITLTDGTTSTFSVENGKGISSISKTGTSGLVDTYTTTYNDGTTSTFTVTNGEGIQNLQIGGRNLYKDTKDFNNPSVWINYDNWQKTGETYNGFTVVGNNNEAWGGIQQYISAKEGEVYTFSAYIKNVDGVSATVYTKIDNEIICYPDVFSVFQSTDFVRSTFTFRITKNGKFAPRIECNDNNNANKLKICGLKLERGNVATDWTPAPEDLETTAITNAEIDNIVK